MPRRSRKQHFAALEDESIRSQIPSKILPLIEQLVMEQCVPVTAALTLQLGLLEIRLEQLERRLGVQHQQCEDLDPSDDWDSDDDEEETPPDAWKDADKRPDEEIPF